MKKVLNKGCVDILANLSLLRSQSVAFKFPHCIFKKKKSKINTKHILNLRQFLSNFYTTPNTTSTTLQQYSTEHNFTKNISKLFKIHKIVYDSKDKRKNRKEASKRKAETHRIKDDNKYMIFQINNIQICTLKICKFNFFIILFLSLLCNMWSLLRLASTLTNHTYNGSMTDNK